YKNKSEYIRDCVRARVDLTPDSTDISETNRLMKRIGSNINQILIRLHSTGHIYAEDITEIKKGVNEIWHTLLSIQSRQQTGRLSATSQTEIRPSTVYMSSLMLAEPTAEVLPPTSEPSEPTEQDGHKSSHTT
ncbi:MAG: plasmid mobilization relaxosome protein MobC, partial [Firmicutes bacterium]|nr:plasmid mobilization relaxosome protein MobC [Bacillota bacterium]